MAAMVLCSFVFLISGFLSHCTQLSKLFLGLGFFLPWLESSQIGFVLVFSGNIIYGASISAACSNSVLAIVIFGVSEL